MKISAIFANKAFILAIALLLLLPLPALALRYGVGVIESGGGPIWDVRGSYAMNSVAPENPGVDHVNSIYVRYDSANKMECGWFWQGVQGKPSWLVRYVDNCSAAELTSYNGGVSGWPTPDTSYGLKIENAGFNSKTWYAKVNNYTKYSRTYAYLAYGRSIIGSERESDIDDNDAHFWSCQRIPNQSGQSWTYWSYPQLYIDNDPLYYWYQVSATEHYVKK